MIFFKKSGFLLFVYFLLILANCQSINQIIDPVEINGKSIAGSRYKDAFLVYSEPEIRNDQLEDFLETGYIEWRKLKKNFFPGTSSRIGIVIYKNKKSYQQNSRLNHPSIAKYHQKTNRIYLSIDTQTRAWRHELIHALLAGHRLASYRIQEGLAYYLHHQQFSSISCSNSRAKPPEFGNLLPKIRTQKPPSLDDFFFRHKRRMDDIQFTARSAYYMHFMWQKNMLQKSVRYYTKYPSSWFEYEVTRADYSRLKEHYKQFNQWLHTPSASRALPGC